MRREREVGLQVMGESPRVAATVIVRGCLGKRRCRRRRGVPVGRDLLPGAVDREDVLGRIGECVKGCLPVGNDADGADGRVEAEVTEEFGQTREI